MYLCCVFYLQPGEDPFAALEAAKKERVGKNRRAQLENAKAADKAGALPATLKLAAALPGGTASTSKAAGARSIPAAKRKGLKDEVCVRPLASIIIMCSHVIT
jgi:hypothetical protein